MAESVAGKQPKTAAVPESLRNSRLFIAPSVVFDLIFHHAMDFASYFRARSLAMNPASQRRMPAIVAER
jgi:hypothetical protein